jgi:TonB-dependent starch-binding outer membrane protein SusC
MRNYVMNLQKKRLNLMFKVFMTVFLMLLFVQSPAQEKRTIRGSVKDADTNEALPGATILEKGTNNGTITDIDGNFSLSVNPNGTLQVSYVSYKTTTLPVAGKENFQITLSPDMVGVSDVVVIGYGTVKKSDLTGAVASIAAEDIRQNIGSGIDQALQGRTAGVSVTTNSGTPGAAPTVRIRGMGTITNPNPFYVIDGVPVSSESVGMLNPGDIESMEVLKDASAAAIYGARAANGVVLITTRKAKDGKSNVIFDAYTGVQSVAKKYDVMNGTDWTTLRNAAGQTWVDSSSVLNTDWQDEIFRQAKVSNMQVTFLNGTEKLNSAIIGSYFNQEGIVKGSDYERYTFRVNTSSKIKPWLTVGENFSISRASQNMVSEQNEYTSVIIQALTADPTLSVYNAQGKPSGPNKNNIGNPVGSIERNHNVLQTDQLLGSAYIEIKPFSWLSFKSSVGLEYNNYENEVFTPIFYESVDNLATQTSLTKRSYKSSLLLTEQLLTMQKEFGKHNFQFLAGYSRQSSTYRLSLRQTYDVPENPDLWFLSNRGINSSVSYEDIGSVLNGLGFSGNPWDASMVSYLSRLIYSYDNRYDLTVSVRRDGSSKFGKDNRWGNFPSFAAGWKITEESFFPQTDIVTFLKLRAGWGVLGNQEIGDYAAYTSVTTGDLLGYTLGPWGNQTSYPGGAPQGFANSGIKWESTEQTNFGLDANLLKNRLTINVDYFIRLTNDMLAQVPVTGASGIEIYPWVNAGSVSNKGYEINVAYRNQDGAFKYKVGGNFGSVKNEVTKLGNDLPINSASFRGSGSYLARTEVGMPIACFYGYVTDGIYQTQDEINYLNEQAAIKIGKNKADFDGKAKPGDIKMKDLNEDGVITNLDQTYIGSPHPDFTYGVNVEFEYKGFDFKVFGQGVQGNKIFQATLYYLESGNGYWNTLNTMKDRWQKEGDEASIPRLTTTGQNEANLRYSDRYVKDGSFFRIKSIQLGYTVPVNLTKKVGIEQLRLYVNAQNFFSFHKYTGFDPEIGSGANQSNTVNGRGFLDIGIDRGMYPLSKTLSFGLNLTF